MITLEIPNYWGTVKQFDFTQELPGWGILWERDEDRLTYENSILSMPGGRFYNVHSEPKLAKLKFKLITNNMDLYPVDHAAEKITEFCMNPDGIPKTLYLVLVGSNHWRRKCVLSNMRVNYGTKFHTIDIEFSLADNRWYTKEMTFNDSNIVLDPVNGNEIEWNFYSAEGGGDTLYAADFLLKVRADMKGSIFLDDPIAYYDAPDNDTILIDTRSFAGTDSTSFYIELDTERHTMKRNGVLYPSPVPPGTLLDRNIKVMGSGTIQEISVKFRVFRI
jgi:hypothetical protein